MIAEAPSPDSVVPAEPAVDWLAAGKSAMQVTLVDSGGAVLDRLQKKLQQGGHRCYRYGTALELMAAVRRETFDLLVIDWTASQAPEIDLSEWISATFLSPMVPFLSEGLADEGLQHDSASSPGALAATLRSQPYAVKVNALLCRRGADTVPSRRPLRFGPYRFDEHADAVILDDTRIVLTSKEYTLSLLLFMNCGRTLSRTYMMDAVWKSTAKLSTRTLDVHISRIRAKLKLADNGFSLRTLFGHGYCLERCATLT